MLTNQIHRKYKLAFLLLTALLSVIGAAIILHATKWGPWAFSDSAAYISSARNMNNGMGVVLVSPKGTLMPLEHFPPLYPLSLSALAGLGMDYLTAARAQNAFLFGVLVFIIAWGALTLTENLWLALVSSLLVLFSPIMLNDFTGAMSEPLFITLLYAAIIYTLIYIRHQKIPLFVLATLLTSLSPLVRYIGIFTLVVNSLLILTMEKTGWGQRFKKCFVFGLLACLPISLWFLSSINSHSVGGRILTHVPDLMSNLTSFWRAVGGVIQSWLPYMGYRVGLFPDNLKTAVFVITFVLLFTFGQFFYFKNRYQKRVISASEQIMLATSLTIIIYFFILFASYLFTFPPPVINSRMLSPLMPAIVLLLASCVYFLIEQLAKRWKIYASITLILLAAALTRYYSLRSLAIASELHEKGYGYTSREIQTSGFIKAVQKLSPEMPMISNVPAMVLLYTNRMPYALENLPNRFFGDGESFLETMFRTRNAALILDFASIRNVYPEWEELLCTLTCGLDVFFKDNIGGIYYYPLAASL